MKMLIFHARQYAFQGKDGGQVRGNEIQYLEALDGMHSSGCVGAPILNVRADDAALTLIMDQMLPGVFDVEFGRRPGPKGKPETFIISAKLLKPVKVKDLLA